MYWGGEYAYQREGNRSDFSAVDLWNMIGKILNFA